MPESFVGVAYSTQLFASGGVEPYKWSATGKLPDGLSLSDTGALTGVPTTATRHGTLTFAVRDAHGKTASSIPLVYVPS